MASGGSSDEAEKTIEAETEESETSEQADTHQGELYSAEKRAATSLVDQEAKATRSSQLSEAAVDLTFAFFEGSLAILALAALAVTLTTSLSLFSTAGAFMLLAGIFEVVRRSVKAVDSFGEGFS